MVTRVWGQPRIDGGIMMSVQTVTGFIDATALDGGGTKPT